MSGQQMIDAAELSAAGHGYIRCRDKKWADSEDYIRLSVLLAPDGTRSLGPWAHLYARRTQEAIGEPTPQRFVTFQLPFNANAFLTSDYDVWTGAIDPAETDPA